MHLTTALHWEGGMFNVTQAKLIAEQTPADPQQSQNSIGPPGPRQSKSLKGAIAGGTVGATLIVITIIGWFLHRRLLNSRKHRNIMDESASQDSNVEPFTLPGPERKFVKGSSQDPSTSLPPINHDMPRELDIEAGQEQPHLSGRLTPETAPPAYASVIGDPTPDIVNSGDEVIIQPSSSTKLVRLDPPLQSDT
ncbi:hypothetical protein Moror_5508 [Moniliophthora roreri MCA 2997]|uniref:Uncharacterized protein n=2 Tax=Moniliophthora roreri TaxID=221103 RepID=V2WN12_MONRO|nr:hypothetical protein Moror_5508 [Moniliophthora roreri MCA 2997]